MQQPVYIQEASLITPLGFTIADNISAIEKSQSAIQEQDKTM